MSVMGINDETFVKVYNTLLIMQETQIKFTISHFARDAKTNLFNLIDGLRKANIDSYNERYNKNCSLIPFSDVISSGTLSRVQLLKSLQCIDYNIELKEYDYSFIKKLIEDIKDSIINSLPEYEAAKWE